MNKLSKILVSVGLMAFCSSVHSEDTTAQKQDTVGAESGIPIECVQVIQMSTDVATLAVDSKGYIYANVTNIHVADIYNPMGEKEGEIVLQDANTPPPWTKNLSPITGTDIDVDDNVYLCNAGHITVEKFTTAGDFLKKIVIPKSPFSDRYGIDDVVVDKDGTIYVVAHSRLIYIFDKDGNLLKKWPKSGNKDDQYGCVTAIAIDRYKNSKQKRIYVGDGGVCRVYVFNKDRRLLFSFGNRGSGSGEMLDIAEIDVDSEGYIYVLDRWLCYCSVFDNNGKFLFKFGRGEKEGEKNLYFPASIFIDEHDKIYVSNSYKGYILVYEWRYDRRKF